MLGITDLDQYSKQFQTVVTFEPGTWNLEPGTEKENAMDAKSYCDSVKINSPINL